MAAILSQPQWVKPESFIFSLIVWQQGYLGDDPHRYLAFLMLISVNVEQPSLEQDWNVNLIEILCTII